MDQRMIQQQKLYGPLKVQQNYKIQINPRLCAAATCPWPTPTCRGSIGWVKVISVCLVLLSPSTSGQLPVPWDILPSFFTFQSLKYNRDQ